MIMCLGFIQEQCKTFLGFKQGHIVIKLIGEQINLIMKVKINVPSEMTRTVVQVRDNDI